MQITDNGLKSVCSLGSTYSWLWAMQSISHPAFHCLDCKARERQRGPNDDKRILRFNYLFVVPMRDCKGGFLPALHCSAHKFMAVLQYPGCVEVKKLSTNPGTCACSGQKIAKEQFLSGRCRTVTQNHILGHIIQEEWPASCLLRLPEWRNQTRLARPHLSELSQLATQD